MLTRILTTVATTALLVTGAVAADQHSGNVKVVFEQPLPNVPGKSIKGVLVEYGPGGSSPSHTHPATAFIYATVLEGAIRSSVNGAPEKIYRAGENFYENPGDFHGVSANASKTERARLLAVFVLDSNEREITTPATKPAGAKH